jgi:hypothetical protein
VVGVTDNASFRSNWYGLNITETPTPTCRPAEVVVDVLDLSGGSRLAHILLLPYSPVLEPGCQIGAGSLDNATLRFPPCSTAMDLRRLQG